MKNSLVVALVCTLHESNQLAKCRKYLQSPLINANDAMLTLFDYLKKQAPDFEERKLEKKYVFHKLFKGQNYQSSKQRDLMARLSTALQDYLLWYHLKTEKDQRDKLFLHALKTHKLDKYFFQKIKEQYKQLGKQDIFGMFQYQRTLQLAHEEFFHPHTNFLLPSSTETLHAILENLNAYFVLATLRYSCEWEVHRQIFPQDYTNPLYPIVRQLALSPPYCEYPLVQVYTTQLDFLESQDIHQLIPLYKRLKSLVMPILEQTDSDSQLVLLELLINDSATLGQKGESDYYTEMLHLYLFGLDHDILLEEGYLPADKFLNLSTLITKLESSDELHVFLEQQGFSQLEDLIKKYASNLPDSIRESSIQLAYAYILFAKTRYGETRRLLAQIQFEDLSFKLRVRILLLQCYYEEGDTSIDDEIRNTDTFLNRSKTKNKISEFLYEAATQFIKVLKKMQAYQQPNAKRDKAALDKLVQNSTRLFAKEWLLAKIKQL